MEEQTKVKKKPGRIAGLTDTATAHVQIYLTVEQKAALFEYCKKRKIPASVLIRSLLIDNKIIE
jgi:hypothetical protein